MNYAFNRKREGLVFGGAKDLNASFKDLSAVCDAIRYRSVRSAIAMLDTFVEGSMPVLYSKHNKYMGSRHELGGRKGRYPIKCARIVKGVLANAMANAESKGEDPDSMYVVHASANKTMILPRTASKGALWLGHSMGRRSVRRTDLEFSRVEVALGYGEEEGLSAKMKAAIAATKKGERVVQVKEKEKSKAKPKAVAEEKAKVKA